MTSETASNEVDVDTKEPKSEWIPKLDLSGGASGRGGDLMHRVSLPLASLSECLWMKAPLGSPSLFSKTEKIVKLISSDFSVYGLSVDVMYALTVEG